MLVVGGRRLAVGGIDPGAGHAFCVTRRHGTRVFNNPHPFTPSPLHPRGVYLGVYGVCRVRYAIR